MKTVCFDTSDAVRAGVGYLFHLDPVSKASVIGGGGLKTDNGTWAGAAAASLYLAENAWQVKAGYAYFDANVNFYGIGEGAGDAGVALPDQSGGLGRRFPGAAQGVRQLQRRAAGVDPRHEHVVRPRRRPSRLPRAATRRD